MERRSIDILAINAMVLMCAVMGAQQVAIKSVAADMSPLLQLAIRSGIAAILVMLLMLHTREKLTLSDGTLLPGMLLGTLFALEYFFLGEALRFIPASRAVVLLYTAPVFAALVLCWIHPEERLSRLQWSGMVIAFVGIVVTFMTPLESSDSRPFLLSGDLMGLLAGLAWGLSTVTIRVTTLAKATPTKTLLYQLVVAYVVLQVSVVALDQTHYTLSGALVANLIFQAVIVSFACFLLWVKLLKLYRASELGVLSFLTPIIGVAFGVYFLDESLTLRFLIGASLVILGIVFVSGNPIRFRKAMP